MKTKLKQDYQRGVTYVAGKTYVVPWFGLLLITADLDNERPIRLTRGMEPTGAMLQPGERIIVKNQDGHFALYAHGKGKLHWRVMYEDFA